MYLCKKIKLLEMFVTIYYSTRAVKQLISLIVLLIF